ncbi:PQQ-dependent dehydrogenase, methanol/ethanol family [Caulobacter sp. AP07]|uniref:PQQ-dependent dehydrogenase, methanol/ethanol family n=1 Tax=Caulobacter sp. AP07 TaxID=1144304 RepID=UPI0002720730|nr:PQQ-dependent dehydrogenase, methanol/ethanol family [Caulobacter sp. AP07]EJL27315.1 PQQ-dependent dehydrogenase, methanol/ethanol family [Caulobacter sp. AP07]
MSKHPAALAAMLLAGALAIAGCGGRGDAPSDQGGASVAAATANDPTGQRIIDAAAHGDDWLSHGRGYDEARHSPASQINTSNVKTLGLAWSYDLDTNRGQEATPLVVDGVIYTTSAWSKVQALDGLTGKLLWQFDPKVPGATAAKACCDVVNRGVAYWGGKVFVGALDGRLIALDAKTGQTLWSVVTVDQARNYTITGAPRVIKGRVIIGNGGAEFGVRGYVSAYDADSGKLVWRFYTVPGSDRKDGAASDPVMAMARKTWTGDWHDRGGGGGGTVWDSMAYDPALDLLYLGVGNGSYWRRTARSPGGGDNLFIASILALRPETGEYVWHYQQTPGDQWDYTSTQHMILADLQIGGQPRKVLLQAPKNGFFYVLDRVTGKLISAKPFSKVNWAKGVDPATGRPIVTPEADYSKTGKPFVAMPGPLGAHDWMPMAMNPATGLVYIPAQEMGFVYQADAAFKPMPKGVNLGVDLGAATVPDDPKIKAAIRKSMKGYLLAWDPRLNKEVWRAPHAGSWNGGVLSTAGNLVFQGDGDGQLNAYDAKVGTKLWSYDVQTGIVAAPVSWSRDGKQYITVVAGWGGAFPLLGGELAWGRDGPRRNLSRVLTFALNGAAKLPPPPPARPRGDLQLPSKPIAASVIETGRWAFDRTCSGCHGPAAASGGIAPDLRYSPVTGDADTWRQVVSEGVLADNGMVSFKENFSPAQIEAIRAYVLSRAAQKAQEDARPPPGGR